MRSSSWPRRSNAEDALFRLLFRAEGGQQQTLGGVGLLEFLKVLRGDALQGIEGLGWDLLLDSGAERAPGCRVVGDSAREAPQERRAPPPPARPGGGPGGPWREDVFQGRGGS